MASSTVQPYPGPFFVDCQTLEGVAVDVVPGGTRGFRRQKAGILEVIAELAASIPVHAQTLGVAPDTHTRINTLTDQLVDVRAKRAIVDKLAEVLEETEVYLEDEREGVIGVVVDAARLAARRKDPAVLAVFEKTIQYHGQIATRAAKTRRKNAEAEAEAAANDVEEAPPAPPQ